MKISLQYVCLFHWPGLQLQKTWPVFFLDLQCLKHVWPVYVLCADSCWEGELKWKVNMRHVILKQHAVLSWILIVEIKLHINYPGSSLLSFWTIFFLMQWTHKYFALPKKKKKGFISNSLIQAIKFCLSQEFVCLSPEVTTVRRLPCILYPFSLYSVP